MAFIQALSTISHNNTFNTVGWEMDELSPKPQAELCSPDFKDYIPVVQLRRLSALHRMAIATTKQCMQQAQITELAAICFGTGLGCLEETQKFLENNIQLEGLLPPTAFINSTHNAISGQIALLLKQHCYNMTHTQNSLSFEMALLDAMSLNKDGAILVSSADVTTLLLREIVTKAYPGKSYTSGSTSMLIATNKTQQSKAEIVGLNLYYEQKSTEIKIQELLADNNLDWQDVEQVIFTTKPSHFNQAAFDIVENYVGFYISNSAFAYHLATQKLQTTTAKKVCIVVNNTFKIQTAVGLIKKI